MLGDLDELKQQNIKYTDKMALFNCCCCRCFLSPRRFQPRGEMNEGDEKAKDIFLAIK